ncbi:YbaB/EbfC family nucleoid-associated protein [Microbacterium sp. RG1]|uniref:YbaB/EbfC family nucleoid-associated protein n=1 Tax=Microbacterium sp. RG1 TaxID=2489212 RepID=UPI0010CA5748|nr:YbaB/EbfC family nucleoid-associated protein [Microbacterium sp. RG1]QCQ17405.1 YbaB/EbfC family DNA-binding protein [Microbacterium sp. RG1]
MDQTAAEEVREALQRIDEQVAQAAAHADEMQLLAAQISELSAEVSSPRGEVSITVDVSGRLTDLRFDDSAFDLTPRELSALVLDAVAEGYRRTSTASVDLAEATLGPQSPTVAHLRDGVEANAPRINRPDEGTIR